MGENAEAFEEIHIGSIVPITEEEKAIHVALRASEVSRAGFREASVWLEQSNRDLWAVINELHPELAGWECSYDHKAQEIVVLRRTR